MKRRYIFISIICTIISLFIIGGKDVKADIGGQDEQIGGNLTVVTAGQNIEKYIDQFNTIYPNVNVEVVALGDYENEIKDMIDIGEYGDVLLMPSFISYDDWDKYFEPLGEYSTLSKQYLFMNVREKNGKVYGFPMCANAQSLVYNKKVFDEAGIKKLPTTIDEFLSCLKMIDENTEAIPFYTNYNTAWALINWQNYTFGAMSGDEDYRFNRFAHEKNPFIEGKNHYRVYKLLYDIVNQGLCEEDVSKSDWDESKRLLNEGKVGCIALASWIIPQAKSAGEYPDNIGYMPFPNSIKGKQYMTIDADYAYAISINSKNKKAARAWIDFMIQDSGYARDNGAVSIIKADPLPTWLNEFENVEFIIDNFSRDNNGYILGQLGAALELNDGQQQRRIIDAAQGRSQETFEDIMKEWNERWESARPEESIAIEETEIFSQSLILDDSYEIFFSTKEKEYLAENKEIKVGYIENIRPLQYKKDEMFVGISADVFEFIREKTNLNFVYQPFDTFTEAVRALRLGKIDAIAGMEKIELYEDELSYSKDYLEYLNVIVKQKTVDINNLKQKTLGMLEGEFKNYNLNLNPDIIRHYSTTEECLEAVNGREVDFIFSNYYTVNECFREKNYNNLVVQPVMEQGKYYVAFRSDVDVRLMAIINKVIYSISPEQKQAIVLKNTQGTYNPPTLKDLIEAYPMVALFTVIIICCIIIAVGYYLMYLQISHNKALAINAKKYEQLADIAGEYIFEYNYQQDSIIFGEKLKKRLSLGDGEKKLGECTGQAGLHRFIDIIRNTKKDDVEQIQVRLSLHSEEQEWYQVIYSIVYDEHKKPLFLIGKLINIQKQVEERTLLEEQAEKDQLTGVYNRIGFYKMLDKSRIGQLKKGLSALCIIDLDEFKHVNDTLGHAGGDELLVMLSHNLQKIFKNDAIISRFGGDEFMVYIKKIDTIEELHSKAKELCSSMDTVLEYNNNTCKASISMGVAIDHRNMSYEDLLDKADKALYKAKNNGRNQYNIYEND